MTNPRTDPIGRPIGRDVALWRRIHKDHCVKGRITTAAFKGQELSVDIAHLCDDMKQTLQNGAGVASFLSAVAFDNNQDVQNDPIEGNHAHALVIGAKPRLVLRAFRDAANFTPREEIEAP